MQLFINGESRSFSEGISVSQLLLELGIEQDGVAVELNLGIVPKSEYGNSFLAEGDRLEIVEFIGGG